jgi:hypothetical protein
VGEKGEDSPYKTAEVIPTKKRGNPRKKSNAHQHARILATRFANRQGLPALGWRAASRDELLFRELSVRDPHSHGIDTVRYPRLAVDLERAAAQRRAGPKDLAMSASGNAPARKSNEANARPVSAAVVILWNGPLALCGAVAIPILGRWPRLV